MLKDDIQWPEWVYKITQVSHLLTVLNSSINFYIYVAKQGFSDMFSFKRSNGRIDAEETEMVRKTKYLSLNVS